MLDYDPLNLKAVWRDGYERGIQLHRKARPPYTLTGLLIESHQLVGGDMAFQTLTEETKRKAIIYGYLREDALSKGWLKRR